MKKLFRITCDSQPDDSGEASFQVYTPRGVVEFRPCEKGLHYLDLAKGNNAELLCTQVVPTVQGNFQGYTMQEIT